MEVSDIVLDDWASLVAVLILVVGPCSLFFAFLLSLVSISMSIKWLSQNFYRPPRLPLSWLGEKASVLAQETALICPIDDLACPLCVTNVPRIVLTCCKQTLCEVCLMVVGEKTYACPYCRRDLRDYTWEKLREPVGGYPWMNQSSGLTSGTPSCS